MNASLRIYFIIISLIIPFLLSATEPQKINNSFLTNPIDKACAISNISSELQNCQGPNMDMIVNFTESGCFSFSQYKIIVTKYESNVFIADYEFGPFDYTSGNNTQFNLIIPEDAGCSFVFNVRVEDINSGIFAERDLLYCCDCYLENFVATVGDYNCNEGSVEVEFDYLGYNFEDDYYYISDGSNTHYFSPTAPRVFDMNISCSENTTLTLYYDSNEECNATFLLPPFCFQCTIENFTANYIENSCDEGMISVNFDFDGFNYECNDYVVYYEENYYYFSENDPKVIQVPSYCSETIELRIRYQNSEECETTFLLPPACCDCVINNISHSELICEDSTFYTLINIDADGTCTYTEWLAEVNGLFYYLTESGNDYIASGIYSPDSIVTINICNETLTITCQELEVINPCYSSINPPDPCSITSFSVWQDTICNAENAKLRFEYNANNSFGVEGYIVSANGFSQVYNSNDSKIINYPSYCDSNVVFTITDIEDQSCSLIDTILPICCPCTLDTIYISTSDCENGLFDINLQFYNLTGSCNFGSWTVEFSDSIYVAKYINNYWSVDSLSSSDSLITYEVCSSFGECFSIAGINPCFDTTEVNLPCQLDSFNVFTLYDCNNGFIINGFTTQGTNFGDSGYYISEGLNTYNFDDNEPQEFSSFGSCTGALFISIFDNEDSLCTLSDTIYPCCNCTIDSFYVSAECGNNDLINLTLELFDIEGYCSLNGWTVSVNTIIYPMYIDNDSNYFALNIATTDTILNLTFCTNTGQQFCFTETKINPCLVPGNLSCKISNANIAILNQNNPTAKIELEQNGSCGNLYNVSVDDELKGTFPEFEGIIFVPLELNNEPMLDFKICNLNEPIFCIEKEVENPFYLNSLSVHSNNIKIDYNNGTWKILNESNLKLDFNLYNSIGQRIYKRAIQSNIQQFEYNPAITGVYYAIVNGKNFNKYKVVFVR